MKAALVLALALVACGGAAVVDDADDDAELAPDAALDAPAELDARAPDASDDAAPPDAGFGSLCVIGDAGFACKPGSSWAWGDGSACFDEPCPSGSRCALLGVDAAAGSCL